MSGPTRVLEISGLVADHGDLRRPLSGPPAVADLDLTVDRGAMFTLLGPSGCGKTTALRCVAGLHRPRGGSITIGGLVVADPARGLHVAPDRRRVGMVFQSHAIWPHLDVYGNAAFPLTAAPRRRRRSQKEIHQRVTEVLELLQLGALARRPAARLSGGQQQRLALARALVPEPEVLLLDEPFSNLDAPLRGAMRRELRRLQQDLGVTILFVTHDQEEALALASQVGVMFDGHLAQVGTPSEVYEHPASTAVAGFVGRVNLLPGCRSGGRVVSDHLGPIQQDGESDGDDGEDGAVVLMVRPERVRLTPAGGPPAPNTWSGVIRDHTFTGDAREVVVEVGGVTITAKVPSDVRCDPPGARVRVTLPASGVRVLAAPSQRSGSNTSSLPEADATGS